MAKLVKFSVLMLLLLSVNKIDSYPDMSTLVKYLNSIESAAAAQTE
jgi:hypothetical protein